MAIREISPTDVGLEDSIIRGPISADEIAFVTPWPTGKVGYTRALEKGEFCNYFTWGWAQFRDEVAQPLEHIRQTSTLLGFRFEELVTKKRLEELFKAQWKLSSYLLILTLAIGVFAAGGRNVCY